MERYDDGALVTGPKLVDFLRKIPLTLGNQNKGPNHGKPVGIQSLNNYVAGVMDLYQVIFSAPSLSG
jgi:hypothetical protein